MQSAEYIESCEAPLSKASESRTISADVMASDDASTGAVPPGKLENQNGTVEHSVSHFVVISNSVMNTTVKEGNGGTTLSLIDHSRAGLPAAHNNSQLLQLVPSPPEVASSALVSESHPASMGVTTPTSLLPHSTPSLDASHLVLEQREDISLNEESMANKAKSKKRSKNSLQDAGADRDVHKSKEKIRWKDVWVAQLIHIRGRMHSTFTNPQRQRVDLWQIVEREMTNSCFGFDKDSEACRKKWLRVYKEYKDDLHLSNKEESQKCRFYDLVDFYVGNRPNSNICNAAFHPDVLPIAAEPAHVMNEVNVKPEDSGAIVLLPNPNVVKSPTMKKPHAPKRPRITEKPLVIEKSQSTQESGETATPTKKASVNAESSSLHTMLSELVTIGKEMLQTTREYEKEKLSVLHSMKDMLGRIAKKL